MIIIFLSSTILDHREASDPVANIEEGENPQIDELDFEPKKENYKDECQDSRRPKKSSFCL